MKQPFYTDREHGQKPRITETINKAVWGGIYALVSQRLADNSLGQRFPDICLDGHGICCGYDDQMLRLGDKNARCKVSRAPGQRKDFSQSTPRYTTHSTSNAISFRTHRAFRASAMDMWRAAVTVA